MIAVQTTRYTLPMSNEKERAEAYKFAAGVEAFYGYGGAEVHIHENGRCLFVEYDHIIETRETVFGS